MRAGDEQKPHPIRVTAKGRGMGFILRATRSLKVALSQGEAQPLLRPVVCLDLSAAVCRVDWGRSGEEWKQRECLP